MQTITITSEIQTILADLSDQLHLSEMEILQQAVEAYARRVQKKQKLMSFAGILTDFEADELLQTVLTNRVNKDVSLQL